MMVGGSLICHVILIAGVVLLVTGEQESRRGLNPRLRSLARRAGKSSGSSKLVEQDTDTVDVESDVDLHIREYFQTIGGGKRSRPPHTKGSRTADVDRSNKVVNRRYFGAALNGNSWGSQSQDSGGNGWGSSQGWVDDEEDPWEKTKRFLDAISGGQGSSSTGAETDSWGSKGWSDTDNDDDSHSVDDSVWKDWPRKRATYKRQKSFGGGRKKRFLEIIGGGQSSSSSTGGGEPESWGSQGWSDTNDNSNHDSGHSVQDAVWNDWPRKRATKSDTKQKQQLKKRGWMQGAGLASSSSSSSSDDNWPKKRSRKAASAKVRKAGFASKFVNNKKRGFEFVTCANVNDRYCKMLIKRGLFPL